MSALLQANQATLLIVDMQGRLMPAIHDGQAVLAAAHKLAQAARLLGLSRPTLLARMEKYGLKIETRISDE